MKVIITTSGIGSRLGDLTKYTNKSLMKVGDKFAIDYIFDLYKKHNIDFIVTIGYKGDIVKQYLNMVYGDLKISYVEIDKYDGEGSSLGYSLLQVHKQIGLNEPFIFHCNDTIIMEEIDFNNLNNNTLLGYKYGDSNNYASLNLNGNYVRKINEKGEIDYDCLYTGWSYIKDFQIFWESLEQLYINNTYKSSLSDIHCYKEMMDKNIVFKSLIINNYFDIGTTNIFLKTNANELFKKKFNVLTKSEESISFHSNKVIKFFHNKNINKKRIERSKYFNKDIIPKIFSTSDNFFMMELIDSPPLSDIYEHGLVLKLLEWSRINLWKETTCENFFDNCKKFYYDKTIDRINLFKSKKEHIDYEIINNLNIGKINELINKVNFQSLCSNSPSNFHGDFILDNILYKNNNFYLIDWREDFGGDQESGDMYYDLSKLQHNIYFNHKNIEQGLFFIDYIDESSCKLDLKCNFFLINQLDEFNKFINKYNYDKRKINILTSLIWINMAPLHEYPLSNFLFNFGKYNLYLSIN